MAATNDLLMQVRLLFSSGSSKSEISKLDAQIKGLRHSLQELQGVKLTGLNATLFRTGLAGINTEIRALNQDISKLRRQDFTPLGASAISVSSQFAAIRNQAIALKNELATLRIDQTGLQSSILAFKNLQSSIKSTQIAPLLAGISKLESRIQRIEATRLHNMRKDVRDAAIDFQNLAYKTAIASKTLFEYANRKKLAAAAAKAGETFVAPTKKARDDAAAELLLLKQKGFEIAKNTAAGKAAVLSGEQEIANLKSAIQQRQASVKDNQRRIALIDREIAANERLLRGLQDQANQTKLNQQLNTGQKNQLLAQIDSEIKARQAQLAGKKQEREQILTTAQARKAEIRDLELERNAKRRAAIEERNYIRQLAGTRQGIASLLGGFGGLIKLAGGLVAVQAVTELVDEFVKANVEVQNLLRGLTAIKGTIGAQLEFESVINVADRLGLSLDVLSTSYLNLLAASKGTRLEGAPTQEIFEGLSAAMSVLGGDTQKTQRAFLAITQMMSKGQIYAEEFRQQLGEALPGALQVMSRALQIPEKRLLQLMATGAVSVEALLPFARQLTKEYGVLATQTDTFAQANNRLRTNLRLLFVEVGNTGVWAGITESVKTITGWIKQLRDGVGDISIDFVERFKVFSKGLELGPLATFFSGLQDASSTLFDAFLDDLTLLPYYINNTALAISAIIKNINIGLSTVLDQVKADFEGFITYVVAKGKQGASEIIAGIGSLFTSIANSMDVSWLASPIVYSFQQSIKSIGESFGAASVNAAQMAIEADKAWSSSDKLKSTIERLRAEAWNPFEQAVRDMNLLDQARDIWTKYLQQAKSIDAQEQKIWRIRMQNLGLANRELDVIENKVQRSKQEIDAEYELLRLKNQFIADQEDISVENIYGRYSQAEQDAAKKRNASMRQYSLLQQEAQLAAQDMVGLSAEDVDGNLKKRKLLAEQAYNLAKQYKDSLGLAQASRRLIDIEQQRLDNAKEVRDAIERSNASATTMVNANFDPALVKYQAFKDYLEKDVIYVNGIRVGLSQESIDASLKAWQAVQEELAKNIYPKKPAGGYELPIGVVPKIKPEELTSAVNDAWANVSEFSPELSVTISKPSLDLALARLETDLKKGLAPTPGLTVTMPEGTYSPRFKIEASPEEIAALESKVAAIISKLEKEPIKIDFAVPEDHRERMIGEMGNVGRTAGLMLLQKIQEAYSSGAAPGLRAKVLQEVLQFDKDGGLKQFKEDQSSFGTDFAKSVKSWALIVQQAMKDIAKESPLGPAWEISKEEVKGIIDYFKSLGEKPEVEPTLTPKVSFDPGKIQNALNQEEYSVKIVPAMFGLGALEALGKGIGDLFGATGNEPLDVIDSVDDLKVALEQLNAGVLTGVTINMDALSKSMGVSKKQLEDWLDELRGVPEKTGFPWLDNKWQKQAYPLPKPISFEVEGTEEGIVKLAAFRKAVEETSVLPSLAPQADLLPFQADITALQQRLLATPLIVPVRLIQEAEKPAVSLADIGAAIVKDGLDTGRRFVDSIMAGFYPAWEALTIQPPAVAPSSPGLAATGVAFATRLGDSIQRGVTIAKPVIDSALSGILNALVTSANSANIEVAPTVTITPQPIVADTWGNASEFLLPFSERVKDDADATERATRTHVGKLVAAIREISGDIVAAYDQQRAKLKDKTETFYDLKLPETFINTKSQLDELGKLETRIVAFTSKLRDVGAAVRGIDVESLTALGKTIVSSLEKNFGAFGTLAESAIAVYRNLTKVGTSQVAEDFSQLLNHVRALTGGIEALNAKIEATFNQSIARLMVSLGIGTDENDTPTDAGFDLREQAITAISTCQQTLPDLTVPLVVDSGTVVDDTNKKLSGAVKPVVVPPPVLPVSEIKQAVQEITNAPVGTGTDRALKNISSTAKQVGKDLKDTSKVVSAAASDLDKQRPKIDIEVDSNQATATLGATARALQTLSRVYAGTSAQMRSSKLFPAPESADLTQQVNNTLADLDRARAGVAQTTPAFKAYAAVMADLYQKEDVNQWNQETQRAVNLAAALYNVGKRVGDLVIAPNTAGWDKTLKTMEDKAKASNEYISRIMSAPKIVPGEQAGGWNTIITPNPAGIEATAQSLAKRMGDTLQKALSAQKGGNYGAAAGQDYAKNFKIKIEDVMVQTADGWMRAGKKLTATDDFTNSLREKYKGTIEWAKRNPIKPSVELDMPQFNAEMEKKYGAGVWKTMVELAAVTGDYDALRRNIDEYTKKGAKTGVASGVKEGIADATKPGEKSETTQPVTADLTLLKDSIEAQRKAMIENPLLQPIKPYWSGELGQPPMGGTGGQGGNGYHSGGFVHGVGSGDIVPGWLEPGEYVLNKEAVRRLGRSYLDDRNEGLSPPEIPNFSSGGIVPSGGMMTINVNVGGKKAQLYGTREQARTFADAINHLSRAL